MNFGQASRVDRRGITRGRGRFVGGGAAAQSPADKYPERPIKIIVPFAPGGSTDILARVIGQKMTENWASRSSSKRGRAPPP